MIHCRRCAMRSVDTPLCHRAFFSPFQLKWDWVKTDSLHRCSHWHPAHWNHFPHACCQHWNFGLVGDGEREGSRLRSHYCQMTVGRDFLPLDLCHAYNCMFSLFIQNCSAKGPVVRGGLPHQGKPQDSLHKTVRARPAHSTSISQYLPRQCLQLPLFLYSFRTAAQRVL